MAPASPPDGPAPGPATPDRRTSAAGRRKAPGKAGGTFGTSFGGASGTPPGGRGTVRGSGSRIVRHGGSAIRLTPWRGAPDRAVQIAPVPGAGRPSFEVVCHALDVAAEEGFEEALTTALTPADLLPFERAGLQVRSELHLLAHDLRAVAGPDPAVTVRRPRRHEWPRLALVDRSAFPPFWQLDEAGIGDALDATPSARLRAVEGGDGLVAYAASGRAGARGYLQRLAVHPTAQRRGTGRALVLDGLRWMRRRSVSRAYVNTQVGNDAAVALYESVGFHHEPEGLVVLGVQLDAPGRPPAGGTHR